MINEFNGKGERSIHKKLVTVYLHKEHHEYLKSLVKNEKHPSISECIRIAIRDFIYEHMNETDLEKIRKDNMKITRKIHEKKKVVLADPTGTDIEIKMSPILIEKIMDKINSEENVREMKEKHNIINRISKKQKKKEEKTEIKQYDINEYTKIKIKEEQRDTIKINPEIMIKERISRFLKRHVIRSKYDVRRNNYNADLETNRQEEPLYAM